MSTFRLWIAASAFASLTLPASSGLAQVGVNGLPVGKATRADVERALGKALSNDGPAFAEYKSSDADSKVFVRYREGDAVLERIEVVYPGGKERSAALAGLNQGSVAPSHRHTNDLGNLEEYYAASALVLTYRGAGAASGVHRASYYTREAFGAALARAGGAVAAAPPPVQAAREQRLHFDGLAEGPLPAGLFEQAGVRIVQGNGAPGIYASGPNMVLPTGRSKVLLLAGERTTALTLRFDTPIKRFDLTRIGTAGGASVPTWTLQAFDGAGKLVDSTGEQHGVPARPQKFSVDGANIVRVELRTDNRHGESTWATWNSLPVAELAFER